MQHDRWLEIRQKSVDGLFERSLNAAGDGARTLLYIHGLGESGLGFERLMADPALDAFDHLALDLPGYGKSDWPPEPASLEDQAKRLAGELEKRDLERVVVVGHSMGGVIGLYLCEELEKRGEERILGFIDVEGNVSMDDCAYSGRVAALEEEAWLHGGFEQALDLLFGQGSEVAALRTYYPSMRFCDPRAYYQNSRELVEVSGSEKIASRLAALQTPVLYLLGDPHGTGEHSRALLSEAGIKWKALSPAGHWPFLDQKEDFVEEMLAFLASC